MPELLRKSACINLKGNRIRSFAVAASPFVSFIFMLLNIISSIYLLIIDTELLGNSGVFENPFIHFIICLLFFSVSIILFCLHIYFRIYSKNYFVFYSIEEITIKTIFKAMVLYALLFFIKLLQLIFFMMPFLIVASLAVNVFAKGAALPYLVLIAGCSVIIFFGGVASFAIYTQRYFLADVFLYTQNNKSVINAIKQSVIKMDGKCKRSALFDIYSFYMKLLSLFLIPAIYFMPVIKAQKAYCVLEKEIPYANKRQRTEKTVVFYF